ncbi:MAG: ParB N-terminal domain-containing protein, partial [Candidatus Bathyarchaeia archaeon]
HASIVQRKRYESCKMTVPTELKLNRAYRRLVIVMSQDQVQDIPILRIRPSRLLFLRPLGPRDFAKIAELSESMKAVGQLEPILVSEQLSDGSYEVVFGNHRFEACKRLGWQTIRCHVRTSLNVASSTGAALEGLVGVRIHPEHVPLLAVVLQQMGFTDPIFQERKKGQRFGLSRHLSSLLEWHVRGFADGMLDSEVEISRNWLQHLAARSGSYFSPLLGILDRIGIPFSAAGGIPPDAAYVYLPELFGQMIPLKVPSITL